MMCSTLFSRATCAKKQARVTPNGSVLYGLEMRRRPSTFRSPTLWGPVALTSLGELIITAHNNF